MIQDKKWVPFLLQVAKMTEELSEGYLILSRLVTPEKTTQGGGGGGTMIHSPSPIDLGVVDLMTQVDTEVDKAVQLARGALRMGVGRAQQESRAARTITGLKFVCESIGQVWEQDPTTGAAIVDALWELRRPVTARTATGPRSYLTEAPCTQCGAHTVVIDTKRARSKCAECGHMVTTGNRIPTSIETPTESETKP